MEYPTKNLELQEEFKNGKVNMAATSGYKEKLLRNEDLEEYTMTYSGAEHNRTAAAGIAIWIQNIKEESTHILGKIKETSMRLKTNRANMTLTGTYASEGRRIGVTRTLCNQLQEIV
jgi:hypothetical protein